MGSERPLYEIHYAVRSLEEAAYLDHFPASKTTVYARSRNERLRAASLIPTPEVDGTFRTKIYCCAPVTLMKACRDRTEELDYPNHLLQFESFGTGGGGPRGEEFEAHVNEVESG